jgi:nicotinamidase-related amidase
MAATALIVVDMVNAYDFEDADALAESASEALGPIRSLLGRASEEDVEVVYVNDNYGHWNSSREELVDEALGGRHPELVEPILPPEDSSFVIKARHSIFYGTPLEYLLGQKEVGRLVLAGQVTEQCILYSALDAYVRHHQVTVPRDAVAHIDPELAQAALTMMERNMRAEVCSADEIELGG